MDPKEALIQFIVVTNQSFTICDHPAFKALYTSPGTICPITNADSLHNAVGYLFEPSRAELKEEMLRDCVSFSISFDGWSAGNHTHILGVIAHWITPDWERRSITIEFAEMQGKSGTAMSELIYASFGPNYIRWTEIIKDNVRRITTEKHVGLEVIHKLFAVCGDNATPNDTLCDHLY
jgi:hypothetical protein